MLSQLPQRVTKEMEYKLEVEANFFFSWIPGTKYFWRWRVYFVELQKAFFMYKTTVSIKFQAIYQENVNGCWMDKKEPVIECVCVKVCVYVKVCVCKSVCLCVCKSVTERERLWDNNKDWKLYFQEKPIKGQFHQRSTYSFYVCKLHVQLFCAYV